MAHEKVLEFAQKDLDDIERKYASSLLREFDMEKQLQLEA